MARKINRQRLVGLLWHAELRQRIVHLMTNENTKRLQDTMVRLGEKLLASVCCGALEMGADVLGGYVWARFPLA